MQIFRLLILVSFILMSTIQCADPCRDVSCENGACVEGSCVCEADWEGLNCELRKSARFGGVWSGQFNCEEEQAEAQIQITEDPSDLKKITLTASGLEFLFNGLSFGIDDEALIARINDNYTAFAIDTQVFIIDIPNNPGISAEVYGSGNRVNDSTLALYIKIRNTDFGAFFSCSGNVSR